MSEIKPVSVNDLARKVSGRLVGDGTILIQRVADLENAGEREIAYVDKEKHFAAAAVSNASCLIIPPGAALAVNFRSRALIEVANPKLAFALIAAVLYPAPRREPSIHHSAV